MISPRYVKGRSSREIFYGFWPTPEWSVSVWIPAFAGMTIGVNDFPNDVTFSKNHR